MFRRKLLVGVVLSAMLCLAAAVQTVHAQELNRKELYRRTLQGCVGVIGQGDPGPSSGWVVNVEKRWIVTNKHVVRSFETVEVIFPAFDSNKKIIVDEAYYMTRATRVRGKVISVDSKRDLALVELESMPEGVVALPLAAESAEPGERLHAIGNSIVNKALWGYFSGHLRVLARQKLSFNNLHVDTLFGVSDMQGNPGDSGSAVVNDKGEVVGVISNGERVFGTVARHVDVTELKAFLAAPHQPNRLGFEDYLELAFQHRNKKEWQLALDNFSKALKLREDAFAYLDRGRVFLELNKLAEAIADFDACLKLDPKNDFAHNDRGVAYFRKGDFHEAVRCYNEAIRLYDKDAMYHANRGAAYLQLKELDKALESYNAAIKLESFTARFFQERAEVHAAKGDHETAIRDYTEALRLNPTNARALQGRSRSHAAFGNNTQADADYQAAIRLDPSLANQPR